MTESRATSKRPRKGATSPKASSATESVAPAASAQDGAARSAGAAPEDSAPKLPPREAAVEALMRLAAEQPWNDIEVSDIAREAGLTLAELRDLFPSKGAVLGGLTRIIDRKVLEGDLTGLEEEPSRERLFDVLMRRLDAMEPDRKSVV